MAIKDTFWKMNPEVNQGSIYKPTNQLNDSLHD